MKQCPRCNQTYTDANLNFCLNDGELLTPMYDTSQRSYADDSPPTVMMNDARITNPVNWQQPSASPAVWQGHGGFQNQPFQAVSYSQSKNQTIPTVSLILGILSIVLICCYGGIWLGLPAAILGFIGLKNADSDVTRYGGRGIAVAGLVLGLLSFVSALIFLTVAIVAK